MSRLKNSQSSLLMIFLAIGLLVGGAVSYLYFQPQIEEYKSESSSLTDQIDFWKDNSKGLSNLIDYLGNENEELKKQQIDCKGTALCFRGVVTKIRDGDTIEVDGKPIRLSLVDTPEKGEKGFDEATAFTKSLCPLDSYVLVDQDDLQPIDVFDRMLASVICDGTNLNAALVISENAIIDTTYCSKSEFRNEDWAKNNGC